MTEIEKQIKATRDAAYEYLRADKDVARHIVALEAAKSTRARLYTAYEAERQTLQELIDPLFSDQLREAFEAIEQTGTVA